MAAGDGSHRPAAESAPAPPAAVAPLGDHGSSPPRGLERVPQSPIEIGRYGRMFRHLPPLLLTDDVLAALADSMGPYPQPSAAPSATTTTAAPTTTTTIEPGENPDLPAGYTYLGQFVDHDITFDPTTLSDRRDDPDALVSYRTPRFDLDSLYGKGPLDSPYLYDQEDQAKLLVGRNSDPAHEPEDLPRNQQGRALVGDPRNDVHVILAQLTLAFIRFHNAVVDHLRDQFFPDTGLFAEAQRLTRWHYQWVVIEDYLRHVVGPDVVDQVLVEDKAASDTGIKGRTANLRFFRWKRSPFMPVEFSAAAFRFGHSQVRATYLLNDHLDPLHILVPILDPNPLQHLGGFRPVPKGWNVSWNRFFVVNRSKPQLSRRIDSKMTGPFTQLPVSVDPERRPLALLDLLRARSLGLPSGQAVAAAMATSVPDAELGLAGPTPLWYYVLKEAEMLADGRRLGPTGGRIVAEVLVGLLAGDPSSFLRAVPNWTPELPGAKRGQFTMVDLLRFAGVLEQPPPRAQGRPRARAQELPSHSR